MDINEYINKLWSSLLADDVPSDFGNVTYYGLLKDTLLLFKKLNEEWEIKKDGFNKQIDSAVKILNSAMELLNSVDTSVDELNAKYSEFVNTVNTEIARFEKETNSKIEQLSTSIGETIDEYMNSPEFESKINDKISEILKGSGFEELIQNIIAETQIEFSKVNVSGSNATIFRNSLEESGVLVRDGNNESFRTMTQPLSFNNNIPIKFKETTGEAKILILLTNLNKFIIGNIDNSIQLNSKSRPDLLINNAQQKMAFLSDLINYIDRTNPFIPATSMFKIGKRTVIQTNGGNTNVTLGDFDYPLYLAVKDINTRPKMYTKTGTSFDLAIRNDVTTEVTKQVNSLINKIYHVGRIIETLDPDFNPNTIIGKWEPFGGGRVTVGVDVNNPIMNEAGKTFGENEHTLTVDEMPSHNHPESVPEFIQNTATGSVQYGYIANGARKATEMAGGGQPHNNMQPSITVYRWIRIS